MAFKHLVSPKFVPPLDPAYRPAVLANKSFREAVVASGSAVPLVLGLERVDGTLSRYTTVVYDEAHPDAQQNLTYVERIVKFLLWQRGGWKVYVGGPRSIGEHIRQAYAAGGARAFDADFMGGIYEPPLHRRAVRASTRSRWSARSRRRSVAIWTVTASASTWVLRISRSPP